MDLSRESLSNGEEETEGNEGAEEEPLLKISPFVEFPKRVKNELRGNIVSMEIFRNHSNADERIAFTVHHVSRNNHHTIKLLIFNPKDSGNLYVRKWEYQILCGPRCLSRLAKYDEHHLLYILQEKNPKYAELDSDDYDSDDYYSPYANRDDETREPYWISKLVMENVFDRTAPRKEMVLDMKMYRGGSETHQFDLDKLHGDYVLINTKRHNLHTKDFMIIDTKEWKPLKSVHFSPGRTSFFSVFPSKVFKGCFYYTENRIALFEKPITWICFFNYEKNESIIGSKTSSAGFEENPVIHKKDTGNIKKGYLKYGTFKERIRSFQLVKKLNDQEMVFLTLNAHEYVSVFINDGKTYSRYNEIDLTKLFSIATDFSFIPPHFSVLKLRRNREGEGLVNVWIGDESFSSDMNLAVFTFDMKKSKPGDIIFKSKRVAVGNFHEMHVREECGNGSCSYVSYIGNAFYLVEVGKLQKCDEDLLERVTFLKSMISKYCSRSFVIRIRGRDGLGIPTVFVYF